MWWIFGKRKKEQAPEYTSIWKEDFSDCVTSDYLPQYSVCLCGNNRSCRHLAMYAGMELCSNPNHKSYIPEGSEPFDPHKRQFNT
ncbi:hypothetical protein PDESU_02925 [Pontiella desulfatans]|uniref:Uncharacterized protein n=1 Tax=Pontiella desulfatans TaxID=2750659 RepID=A0A6C2U4C3_PONDE|nr:hypothetical protein PDESU_02925 [Pontiella desulfatans]